MSTMTIPRYLIATLLLTSAIACGDEPVGISVQAASSTSSSSSALTFEDAGGTSFEILSAVTFLRDIELDVPDGSSCDDVSDDLDGGADCSSDTVKIPGPFIVDLLAGTSTPPLDAIRIPANIYKRIDFRIDDGVAGEGGINAGDPLDDRSFVVTANFSYGGNTNTLLMSFKFNEDVRFEDPNGIAVESEGHKLLVKLDAATWLAGIDIAGCLDTSDLDLNGTELIIDDDGSASGSGSCSSIENTIKTNIKTSGQLDRLDD